MRSLAAALESRDFVVSEGPRDLDRCQCFVCGYELASVRTREIEYRPGRYRPICLHHDMLPQPIDTNAPDLDTP